MKKIITAITVILVLVVAYSFYSYVVAVDLKDRVVTVIIKPGDGFSSVADQLVTGGVVHSRKVLKYAASWRGIDRILMPGRYDFTGRNSCRSVLDKLEQADFVRVKVTVYEGAPIWKVASVLAQQMEVDSTEVIALNHDSTFLSSLGLPYLEGYLFPQTYFFPWGTPLKDMIRDMVIMFHQQTDTIWPADTFSRLSIQEVIILASIVQAETRIDEEKATIASVYRNRIKKGMKLDADPSVIYGLGGLDRPLTTRDLRKATPYNTYLKGGLPPTPINSPGLAAIRAVLYPDSTDYYYFVADGCGRHRFSRTNVEHNRARREIRSTLRKP